MKRQRRGVAIGLAALLLAIGAAGCNKESADPDSSGNGNGEPASECALTGTWTLTSIRCGTTDVTADFKARVTSSVVTASKGANGACRGVLVNTGSTCQETEEYEYSLSGNTNTVTTRGITACNPVGCKFDPNDAACVVGDRAGTYTENTVSSGNTLTATRNDALSMCHQYDQATTSLWTKSEPGALSFLQQVTVDLVDFRICRMFRSSNHNNTGETPVARWSGAPGAASR